MSAMSTPGEEERTLKLGAFIRRQRAALAQQRAAAHAAVDKQFDLIEKAQEADFRAIVEDLERERAGEATPVQ